MLWVITALGLINLHLISIKKSKQLSGSNYHKKIRDDTSKEECVWNAEYLTKNRVK